MVQIDAIDAKPAPAGRRLNRLKAIEIDRLPTGFHADGGGLYLSVKPSGARSWIFRFHDNGRLRDMGLGPTHTVPLQTARRLALEARQARLAGIDPIARKSHARRQAAAEAARAVTFNKAAELYIDAHAAGWSNAKHAAQWRATLEAYAFPVIGRLPAADIDTAAVLEILQPIWTTKPETAGRVRGRVEAILDYAKSRGWRDGENPARWRGHLDHLLPSRAKVAKVEHHAALPYAEVMAFMERAAEIEAISAFALRFLILTAARTSEILGAKWDEIDLEARVWSIPAERMKARRAHRVPLSDQAMQILETVAPLRREDDSPVFPGQQPGRPLSNMAMLKLLARMGRSDVTAHGFRSAFRDWAAEETDFAREVAEMALAHAVGNQVEAAYRRGDLFAKRAELMAAWANYVAPSRG
ncbi:tyrosine-type recombinase/integrase [Acidocella facilis]|uniref:tyrosine-type recombinase/integrase n=1 Tax=Acidocella facilis TaxID=525 RepID=UPI001F1EED73|nr:site-specific integrase [Acidocella facilis]